jgi:hypothetical protein
VDGVLRHFDCVGVGIAEPLATFGEVLELEEVAGGNFNRDAARSVAAPLQRMHQRVPIVEAPENGYGAFLIGRVEHECDFERSIRTTRLVFDHNNLLDRRRDVALTVRVAVEDIADQCLNAQTVHFLVTSRPPSVQERSGETGIEAMEIERKLDVGRCAERVGVDDAEAALLRPRCNRAVLRDAHVDNRAGCHTGQRRRQCLHRSLAVQASDPGSCLVRRRDNVGGDMGALGGHLVDELCPIVLPRSSRQSCTATVRHASQVEKAPLGFHSGSLIRSERGWMLRTERHPPARSVEQFLQQVGTNTGAASVGRNEQVRQHRDPVDVDHSAVRDNVAVRLGDEQPSVLRSDQREVSRVGRSVAFACDRIHHCVVGL